MSEYVNCMHCTNKDCERYGGPYGYTFCEKYIPDVVKEITNADRIRAMSDEELAGHIWNKFGCPEERNYITCGFMGSCKECWLEWLRQPAEED